MLLGVKFIKNSKFAVILIFGAILKFFAWRPIDYFFWVYILCKSIQIFAVVFLIACREFFENRVILKWQKRHLDTSRHFGLKKKFFHKSSAILKKSQEKKAFWKNANLWTLDQKQFLASILNSGAILFFGA
jgi:hypothetical protein